MSPFKIELHKSIIDFYPPHRLPLQTLCWVCWVWPLGPHALPEQDLSLVFFPIPQPVEQALKAPQAFQPSNNIKSLHSLDKCTYYQQLQQLLVQTFWLGFLWNYLVQVNHRMHHNSSCSWSSQRLSLLWHTPQARVSLQNGKIKTVWKRTQRASSTCWSKVWRV